jgi:hypothetical protein
MHREAGPGREDQGPAPKARVGVQSAPNPRGHLHRGRRIPSVAPSVEPVM